MAYLTIWFLLYHSCTVFYKYTNVILGCFTSRFNRVVSQLRTWHYIQIAIITYYDYIIWYTCIIWLFSQARDAQARGDLEGARSKGRIALGCNIAACVWWVVALVIWVGVVAGINASGGSSYSSYSYCYYSSTYYSYYCYK